MKLSAPDLLKIAGLAGLAISPFLGIVPAGMVVGNAILQNLAASGGYEMLGMGGSSLHRRFFNKLGQPNHHLNNALQLAILDALQDIDLEKEFRAIHAPGSFDRDGGHVALETFFQQLRSGKHTLPLPDADNPALVRFLEDSTQENFEALAKIYPAAAFPGLPAEVPEFVFRRLHAAVAARFWDRVKSDTTTWHAYATEVFAQMRESLEGIGEKQDQILALLAGRETLVLHSTGPAAVSPDLLAAIEQQGKNWTAESLRIRQQLDRVEWKITEVIHDTSVLRRALPWLITGIAAVAVIVLWIKSTTDKTSADVRTVIVKQDQQTGMLQEHANLLKEAVVQLEKLTHEKAQLGIKITDLAREDVEKELATRVGVSAVELRLHIEAGKKSQDALIRARAFLLAGKLTEAISTAEEVEKADSPVIARLIESLKIKAEAYFQTADYEKALAARQRIAALTDRDAEPLAWAEAQHDMAIILWKMARHSEAVELVQQVITIKEQKLGPDDPSVAVSLSMLALLLQDQGKLTEAEPLYHRALEIDEAMLGRDHPDVAKDLSNLATLLKTQGKLDEAESLLRRSLEIHESKFGKNHPDVATSLNNLASVLKAQSKLAEAESLYVRALKIDEAMLGKDHPDVARELNNLAGLLQAQGKLAEAEPLSRRALQINEAKLGKEHPEVATNLNNLGLVLADQGKLVAAEPLFRRALAISEAALGKDHPDVASCLSNLASLIQAQGNQSEAEPLFRRALEIDEANLGRDHPAVARDLNYLAGVVRARGNLAEAESLYRRALGIVEASLGMEHPAVAINLSCLASMLKAQGKLAEAESLFRRAIEISEANLGRDHSDVAIYLNNLARLLENQDKLEDAEPLSRRALKIILLHRKRNGTPFEHENVAVQNYLEILKNMGRSPEQIAAKILKLKQEVGLED